jgi:hypothetical protein
LIPPYYHLELNRGCFGGRFFIHKTAYCIQNQRGLNKIKTCTLKTRLMTPPKEGRQVPMGFLPYDGTQEEEIYALLVSSSEDIILKRWK